MFHVNKTFPLSGLNNNILPCDIYSFDKHKRLPFKDNTITFSNCFNLVYMDIWRPLKTPYIFGYKYFLTIMDVFVGSIL